MRISDWSSDVCSSDLATLLFSSLLLLISPFFLRAFESGTLCTMHWTKCGSMEQHANSTMISCRPSAKTCSKSIRMLANYDNWGRSLQRQKQLSKQNTTRRKQKQKQEGWEYDRARPEESRGGKGCVSTCRSRG